MTALVSGVATLLGFAAVATALLVFASTRRVSAGLPVLLDLLLAAGLLRLSATATWVAIGSAAAIVVIRKIATYGIGQARGLRADVEVAPLH